MTRAACAKPHALTPPTSYIDPTDPIDPAGMNRQPIICTDVAVVAVPIVDSPPPLPLAKSSDAAEEAAGDGGVSFDEPSLANSKAGSKSKGKKGGAGEDEEDKGPTEVLELRADLTNTLESLVAEGGLPYVARGIAVSLNGISDWVQVGEVVHGVPAVVLHDAKAVSFGPTALPAAIGGDITINGSGFFKGDKWCVRARLSSTSSMPIYKILYDYEPKLGTRHCRDYIPHATPPP